MNKDILSLLSVGKDGATSLSDLALWTGESRRLIRKRIEGFRREGIPVLSCSRGYFFPESADEIREFLARETKRARSFFYTLRGVKQALSAFEEGEAKCLENQSSVRNSICQP